MSKKVYLGVGHGGYDPGAVAFGRYEKDLALDIARACMDELIRHGVTVMISRETDIAKDLTERIKECNAFAPDVAADIHLNAGGGDGAEVFHAKNYSADDALAQNILNEIVAIGQNSRGLKTKLAGDGTDYFGFIRQIKCPSVLVECAFLDHATDVQIVDTLEERKAMGIAIAKGILKTLGIAYNATATAPATAFKAGDLVSIKAGSKYYNGSFIPNWVINLKWYVSHVSGDRVVINKSEDGKHSINSPVNAECLTLAQATPTPTITVGSTVKLKSGAKTYTGGSLASFVYARNHKVKELNGNRAVITYLGVVVAAVNVNDLILV
jgi:N-acetylmuramoyl-L-alanine amidase